MRIYARFLALFLGLLFAACQDSIIVRIEKDPGTVVGIVHPTSAQASIGLYQDVLIAEVTTQTDGSFRLEDIQPGTYLLRASADGYGTLTRKNIAVTDGETTFIVELLLSTYPWPVRSVEPANGAIVDVDRINFIIRFTEDIRNGTLAGAFSISPEVENLDFDIRFLGGGDQVRVSGDFRYGVTYTFTLDTTLTTHFEQHLEFPLTRTFTTQPFQVTDVIFPYFSSRRGSRSSGNRILIRFNAPVDQADVLDNLVLTPETPTTVDVRVASGGYTDVIISPTISWQAGTATTILFKESLAEGGGATLTADTSFSFQIDSLKVVDTAPYDNQYFIATGANLRIRFNTILDESTIAGAVTLSPAPQVLNFSTGFGSQITVIPDTLLSATTYTVVVDTTLKDWWGGTMSAPHRFTFTTQ
ncbi:MAG: carboxypeptidase regulatory-like domain-containing protein [Candidatus Marinimicrobia bacterium]|nr:carboxypeptidase regulatory-like domain-containing protein [Candidatus Neomarinimicrobiota bacterium]